MIKEVIITLALSLSFGSIISNAKDSQLSEVVDLIRDGKIDDAKRCLARIEKPEKSSDSMLFLLGLLSTNGDSASYFYEQLLRTYPESQYSDDALLRLAQIKYALGLYKAALLRYKGVISHYPNSPLIPKCYYGISLCFFAMGESDSASVWFQKVIDEHPTSDFSNLAQSDIENFKIKSPNHQSPRNQSRASKSDPQTEAQKNSTVQYAIQVGAFSNQRNALLRKAFFEQEGYQVNLRTKTVNGQLYYLIWVGLFDNRTETERFKETLIKKYGGQYTLVSEEGQSSP